MSTPRTARTIACPDCGTAKTTKANTGVLVACTGCGNRYRVPAAGPGAAAAPPAAASSSSAGGVTVTRAKPKATQTARPRAGGAAAPAAPAAPAPRRTDADTGRRGGRARAGYGLAGFAASRLAR